MANSAYTSSYTGAQIDAAVAKAQTVPSVTSSDNGKVMEVVSGAWAAVKPVTIYSGSSAPSSGTGSNGDIYIQTTT